MNKNILMGIAIVVIIIIIIAASSRTSPNSEINDRIAEEEVAEETASPTAAAGKTMNTPSTPERVVSATPAAIIKFTDAGFSPSIAVISRNESVLFVNESERGTYMWVVTNPHPDHTSSPSLNQGKAVGPGGTYFYTFTQTGDWRYHNEMETRRSGLVVVNYD